MKLTYAKALHSAFDWLLEEHREVFVIGQGLWSPWYVGSTMDGFDQKFGRERILDTPVSEQVTTGAGIGAALSGYRPVVTHPRVDFALLAMDQMVNQAAKWSSMFGGSTGVPVTFRCIVNRGGEQGAQHSQSLFSWFAHIPGLRVVTPATVLDAYQLLVASVLCDDPVVFIDDRWLYDIEEEVDLPRLPLSLPDLGPSVLRDGTDVTLASASYGTYLCLQAADRLAIAGIECEVVDLRVLNPLSLLPVIDSVVRTRRLCVVDCDWSSCGLAGEVVATVVESLDPRVLIDSPVRITLADAPAPTSSVLEAAYYPTVERVVDAIVRLLAPKP